MSVDAGRAAPTGHPTSGGALRAAGALAVVVHRGAGMSRVNGRTALRAFSVSCRGHRYYNFHSQAVHGGAAPQLTAIALFGLVLGQLNVDRIGLADLLALVFAVSRIPLLICVFGGRRHFSGDPPCGKVRAQ